MKNKSVFFVLFFLSLFFIQPLTAQTANEDYFTWVKHYRLLLKEDKKAARVIYEMQLQEAAEFYEYEIGQAASESDKAEWKAAHRKTKFIIAEIYEEEVENLENAFEKGMQQLADKYSKTNKTSRKSYRNGLTRS